MPFPLQNQTCKKVFCGQELNTQLVVEIVNRHCSKNPFEITLWTTEIMNQDILFQVAVTKIKSQCSLFIIYSGKTIFLIENLSALCW